PPATAGPLQRPDISTYQAQRLAYQAVFQRWGADLSSWDAATIPCNFAPRAGLQCLSRTGSWSDIHSLNLPVVLELWGQGTSPFYGAVMAMNGRDLELQMGRERYQISQTELRDIWFGSYVVLWQMPPNYQGTLKRGDRHPSVGWLRKQLAELGNQPLQGDEANLFDATLQEAVLAFQREERLLTDGIVGPATWIRLSERHNLPAPKLEG
ncbi:MAG: peptidoglycan-binding protein, partial [Pseudomonadales bacterium]